MTDPDPTTAHDNLPFMSDSAMDSSATGSTLFSAADDDSDKQQAIQRSVRAHHTLAALPGVSFANGDSIVILIHPGFELLDVVGPLHFLSATGATVDLMTTGPAGHPVVSGGGVAVVPTRTVDDLPERPAVVLVPGGDTGVLLRDSRAMTALQTMAATARYVTSVCTGSLALAAAGLLQGRPATCHWSMRHLLPGYGAIEVDARVVEDGNVLTAAGVTAGMDLAVRLVELLCGREYARFVMLGAEYAPEPPLDSGTPATAGAALTDLSRDFLAPLEIELRAPSGA